MNTSVVTAAIMSTLDDHPDCSFKPDALHTRWIFDCGTSISQTGVSPLQARRAHIESLIKSALLGAEELMGSCGDVMPGHPEVRCQKVAGHTTYGHWSDSDEVLYGRTWQS